MIRALIFFAKIAIVVAIAVWLANRPGDLVLQWYGWQVQTSVAILILFIVVIAALSAIGWRLWGRLLGLPRGFRRGRSDRRLRKGYQALTQGMVAVAAGEPDEARRHARRADSLLEEPPLTMLLSAQAAQLNGDEQAAKRYFSRMLEDDDTRFLGLRGLLRQAEREGDLQSALDYARQAYDIRPQTPWVLNSLFDLSLKTGELERALDAVEESRKRNLIDRETARRRRAVILTEQARRAQADGKTAFARDYAKEATDLAPGLVPAVRVRAQLLIDEDRGRSAAKAIEKTWGHQPHPDLAELYLKARPAKAPKDRYQRLKRLAEKNPAHRESELALGRAALEAEQWGDARRHLEAAGGQQPSEEVCRELAELAERQNDDQEARRWLRRTTEAPPDPGWLCTACGAMADDWQAVCGHCGTFDSFAWQTPPRATSGGTPDETVARLETGADGQADVEDAEATEVSGKPAPRQAAG
jgi:HemY protein